MKKNAFVAALFLMITAPTSAADLERGEGLHQTNCLQCHADMLGGDGSAMYTRADRRVTSLAGLKQQVRRCRDNIGLMWFDEDVADVTAFLNTRYYRFEE